MINESYANVDPNIATVLSLIVLFCGASGTMVGGSLAKKSKSELSACALLIAIMLPMSAITLLVGRISYWYLIAAVSVLITCSSAVSFFVTTLVATRFNKFGKGATVAGWLNSLSCFGIVFANFTFTLLAEKFGWIVTLAVIFFFVALMFILTMIVRPRWNRFINNL
jgi:predicted MFS family arabinose efflux permease